MRIIWLLVAASASVGAALACVAPSTAPAVTPALVTAADGVWANYSRSLNEMYDKSELVVIGEVLAVGPGEVIETVPVDPKKPGITNLPKTYFTDVPIRVSESLGGSAPPSQELTVTLPGGGTTPYFNDNPPYARGEVYLLFLKRLQTARGPKDTYHIIHPQGRYRVEGGRLVSLANAYILNRELDGDSLEEVKATLATYK